MLQPVASTQHRDIVLITGGGTGIGAALANLLSSKYKLSIVIVGRTLTTLKETSGLNKNIDYIVADISTDEGIKEILSYLTMKDCYIKYLVNNAAVLNLSRLLDVTNDLFYSSLNINLKAPLMLVKELFANQLFATAARILMIDSSSRYNIQEGMGLYTISKASLFTLQKVMQKEFYGKLLVNSIYPGAVDNTVMAKLMQNSTIPAIMELNKKFEFLLKNNPELTVLSPTESAEFIAWVLCETADDQFINHKLRINPYAMLMNLEEWDIRDSECYQGCELAAGSKLRLLANILKKYDTQSLANAG
jgi:NAD(P)-dependent dehydrogenase (short-subunit alcohol dehydrogenase family)